MRCGVLWGAVWCIVVQYGAACYSALYGSVAKIAVCRVMLEGEV